MGNLTSIDFLLILYYCFMKHIIEEMSQVLRENILAFWIEKMPDRVHGGFIGRIDGMDTPLPDAEKSVILNTRILWSFSTAYLFTRDEACKSIAGRAYDYLIKYFLDQKHGGVYWMVSKEGSVVDSKKQIYAQAFMIYALSAWFEISKDQKVLNHAIDIFVLIEAKSHDKVHGGYLEAYSRDWHLLEDLRLSDKDANEKKTMNTHLHILEAYTALYRVWPDETLRAQLLSLTELFLTKFIGANGHFTLFFDEKWRAKSDKISYGHDIEGSWLLYEAAKAIGDEKVLDRVRKVCVLMTDTFINEGVDARSAVFNESEHGTYDYEFHWWPQAEAMVGLVNAWQITGNQHYLQIMEGVWAFIKTAIIDWDKGEWVWGIDGAGKVMHHEDKAGPWKCPYHNSRALIEVIKRLGGSAL